MKNILVTIQLYIYIYSKALLPLDLPRKKWRKQNIETENFSGWKGPSEIIWLSPTGQGIYYYANHNSFLIFLLGSVQIQFSDTNFFIFLTVCLVHQYYQLIILMILSQDMIFSPLLKPCIFIKGKFWPPYINEKVLYKGHRRRVAFFIICSVTSPEV